MPLETLLESYFDKKPELQKKKKLLIKKALELVEENEQSELDK